MGVLTLPRSLHTFTNVFVLSHSEAAGPETRDADPKAHLMALHFTCNRLLHRMGIAFRMYATPPSLNIQFANPDWPGFRRDLHPGKKSSSDQSVQSRDGDQVSAASSYLWAARCV
jgi:hypothetical protein